MSLSMNIEVTDTASPFLFQLEGKLLDRTGLHSYIAPQAEKLTVQYLEAIAPGRHATANRLGATPTDHLLYAAQAIESGYDADAAWITFPRITGLSRAFRSFELIPLNGKKWLTIPAIKSAYGRRAREFSDLKFVPLGEDGQLAALVQRAKSNGRFIVVFWLKKQVRIEQDRTLLPSDDAYRSSAEIGARNFIRDLKKGDQA